MEERHGGKMVQFLTLEEILPHSVPRKRHAKRFQSNVEVILPYRRRHGGAMGVPCHGKAP